MAYLSPIQFADTNIAGTTLVGTILAGDNTLTLTSAAVLGCPSLPSFDILIDNEFITVNGISGNVCTPLSRGANGTTPAGHTAGAVVYSPITVGMINAAMARIDQANASGFQSPVFTPSGLYAAVQTTSRIVGAVAPGLGTPWTPAGGPYNVGDIVFDISNASYYVCSVAGSPGTFLRSPSLSLAQTISGALTLVGALSVTGNVAVTGTLSATGEISGPDHKATGIASLGNVQVARWIGNWTTVGAPTGLTAVVGDWGLDGNFEVWVCTVLGTPGTWFRVNNMYRFSGSASASQTPASGTWVTMNVNTEAYDPNNNFDTTAHAYTVPKTGIYLLIGNVAGSPSSRIGVRFNKNAGTVFAQNLTPSAASIHSVTVTLALLTAGDVVVLEGFADSATLAIQATEFSIQFITGQ